MPGPDPRKLKIPKGMTQREYLKSLNSPEQQKNIDDVPTRLQRKETTVDEVRMAKGGRAGYKHGGAAKRGHGCEIK
jgi:hypothetical protein